MSADKEFSINPHNFNLNLINELSGYKYAKDLWPIVYILSNSKIKEAYIGETTDTYARLENHLRNKEKNKLSEAYLISSDKFNKSVTLDLEANLIKYIAGDGHYKLLNANLGLTNHTYYQKNEVYEQIFKSIWDHLRTIGVSKHSLAYIDNSDLFKYSPYKSLSREQKQGLLLIINSLMSDTSKHIVIEGGAGTGKTILAIFLFKLLHTKLDEFNFSDFGENELEFFESVKLLQEKYPNPKMALVIPMSSFRETIQKVFKHVKELHPNMVIGPSEAARNDYDLVLVDESHRLRRRVNLGAYYGKFDEACEHLGLDKSKCSELDWILMQSRKAVFFYDENQSIKPSDAEKEDFDKLKNNPNTTVEYLISQFRVRAGIGYVKFVNNLLSVNFPSNHEKTSFKNYEFLLFNNIEDLISEIKSREKEHGLSRLVAGYSWKWISKKDKNAFDIDINHVKLKWNNTQTDWINSENSINEVGCIHTTQGYDLNYAGVIFGNEISYDKEKQEIIIREENYHDKNGKHTIKNPAQLKAFIINIYKTIMLRGIRGTYVYVCDEQLREYFSKHINSFKSIPEPSAIVESKMIPFVNSVPFFNDLAAAAGGFSELQQVDKDNCDWVGVPAHIKVSKDMFACKVIGDSMNKIIENGSTCLFRKYTGGTRNGEIVLVQLTHLQDQDSGSSYTVKEYCSKKTLNEDGSWNHETIKLVPLSNDPHYQEIVLHEDDLNQLVVIGIFECVLS